MLPGVGEASSEDTVLVPRCRTFLLSVDFGNIVSTRSKEGDEEREEEMTAGRRNRRDEVGSYLLGPSPTNDAIPSA